jgi:hypothetical protein
MASQSEENRTIPAEPGGRGRGPCGRLAGLPRSSRAGWCPVPGCHAQIDPSRLMCRRHWYLVPKQLRDRVWATWRSGQGALSAEHLETVRMAIAACQPIVAWWNLADS